MPANKEISVVEYPRTKTPKLLGRVLPLYISRMGSFESSLGARPLSGSHALDCGAYITVLNFIFQTQVLLGSGKLTLGRSLKFVMPSPVLVTSVHRFSVRGIIPQTSSLLSEFLRDSWPSLQTAHSGTEGVTGSVKISKRYPRTASVPTV